MFSMRPKAPDRHYTDADGVFRSMSFADAYCLSTDEKPVVGVANGSCLYEMDTGAFYFFDEENKRWLRMGGGG